MSKKLRNLALLGGLGAAAAMAMRGKGKEEESKDTTGDASAGMAKDRLSDFRGKSGDANKDIGAAVKRATTPAAEPAVTAPARRTTSVQDADAKKAAKYADQYNRDRAQSLYEQKMRRLEKEQALGRVAPEEYIGPGGALKMMSNVARGMAGRNNLRTITQPALTNEARKLTNEPLKLTNMKKGGMVGSASKRADGCATKGKTRGRMV